MLPVRDVNEAVDAFVESLGFRCEGSFAPNGSTVYAILGRSGATIHLQLRASRPPFPAERAISETDLYVEVDDVDALNAEYVARGVHIVRPLREQPYGVRDFAVEVAGLRLAFATSLE